MTVDAELRGSLPSRLARMRLGSGAESYSRLCQEIAESLGLSQVGLLLSDGGAQFRWPVTGEADGWPRRGTRRVPIRLAGRSVATLILSGPVVRRLDPESSRVLDEIADLLGPVLELARLAAERDTALVRARDHAERIAAARRQAFAERDQERRELERDLHDGVQHHLVTLRMSVGLLDVHLGHGDLTAAGTVLASLRPGITQAEQTLLSTAAGSCPPMLVERGIAEALAAEWDDAGQQVALVSELPAGKRYSLVVETAVYFTCLEAVNNARKHAPSASIRIRLTQGPDGLLFSVTDDGPGLDPGEPTSSFGLDNMRSRIQAAGGRLELITVRRAGTTVAGTIPPESLDQPPSAAISSVSSPSQVRTITPQT
jgi:signal transduction histidine kinase